MKYLFCFLIVLTGLNSCKIESNPTFNKLTDIEKLKIPVSLCCKNNNENIIAVSISQFDSILQFVKYDTTIIFTGVINCNSGKNDINYLLKRYSSKNSKIIALGIDDWFWANDILKFTKNKNIEVYLINHQDRENKLESAQMISNYFGFDFKDKYKPLRQIMLYKKQISNKSDHVY